MRTKEFTQRIRLGVGVFTVLTFLNNVAAVGCVRYEPAFTVAFLMAALAFGLGLFALVTY